MNLVRRQLTDLGVISDDTVVPYAIGTRDRADVKVFKCMRSGVIFIPDFYVGPEEYDTGEYRDKLSGYLESKGSFEDLEDADRRYSSFKQFIVGRNIVDFGCGEGSFLRRSHPVAGYAAGVEAESGARDILRRHGIDCFESLLPLKGKVIDTVFLFHVFEHLPDPLGTLRQIFQMVSPHEGKVIIEVPHANDALLSFYEIEEFKKFVLWSQHLVLHTRESLCRFAQAAGFKKITVKGVQRYPLSNHLQWLRNRKAGGHRTIFSSLDNDVLSHAYAESLAAHDLTDTLIMIAEG